MNQEEPKVYGVVGKDIDILYTILHIDPDWTFLVTGLCDQHIKSCEEGVQDRPKWKIQFS